MSEERQRELLRDREVTRYDVLEHAQPALEEPRWADNPFVNGEQASFRYYFATQLVSPRGVVIGTLCVLDHRPHELDCAQRYGLEQVARWIVDVLELRLRSNELEASVVELTRARDELRRSNEVLGVFASQVAHDLRGPITALTASLGMLSEDEEPLSEQQAWLVDRRASSGLQWLGELAAALPRDAVDVVAEVQACRLVVDDVPAGAVSDLAEWLGARGGPSAVIDDSPAPARFHRVVTVWLAAGIAVGRAEER